ncbi:MAG: TldD/PmbA family protein [Candidatus Woesearchaeota archaeon]
MTKQNIDNIINNAKKIGVDCQINFIQTFHDLLSIENNEIKDFSRGNNTRIVVKVWIGKKQGSVQSSKIENEMISRAIKIAKSSKDREYFHGLPEKQSYQKIIPDMKIINLQDEDFVKYGKEIIKDGKDNYVSVSSAYVERIIEKRIVANTNGVFANNNTATFSCSVACVSKDKKASFNESFNEPFFVDCDGISGAVKKKVWEFSKAQSIKQIGIKKNLPIILKTEPLSYLLQYAFLENLNGYNYEKQKSCFIGKIGQKILSNINIWDDGTLQKGLNTDGFDSEGVKRKKTTLFDNGVLKNLAYDYNTAKNNGKESTGNSGLSGIEFSNIVIDGPKGNIDKAFVIETIMGAHTSNYLTTDFSLRAEHAYYYNKGKFTPLKSFMIAGNLVNALGNVIFVGKEQVHKNGVYSGDICCENINVVQ